MWGLVNMMASGVRHRMMPRRKGGMGTMTAMVVGASVGIAAWEAVRKTQFGAHQQSGSGQETSSSGISGGAASAIAEEVLREIES